jgi:hypothetical protein
MNTIPEQSDIFAKPIGRFVSVSFAAAPIFLCLVFYGFTLHWRIFHGSFPDTGQLMRTIAVELVPLETVSAILGFFLFYSFPVWAAFVAFIRHYVFADLRHVGLYFIPWAAVLTLIVIDPGGFILWFID